MIGKGEAHLTTNMRIYKPKRDLELTKQDEERKQKDESMKISALHQTLSTACKTSKATTYYFLKSLREVINTGKDISRGSHLAKIMLVTGEKSRIQDA